MSEQSFRCAVLTASDKGFAGERVDESGPAIVQRMQQAGYEVAVQTLLPDDQGRLAEELKRLCDDVKVDLILTTGGTGFSIRDCMPEAAMDVAERIVPGIAEAIRMESLRITPRAMLSRGVSVIRGQTLIINLPGSPKAVRESLDVILPALSHGLAILTGRTGECGR